ncbi:MAG TPA: hypothetical protein VM656_17565, partial [Pyrinomonadaceae bacterium]|nr:hypothetical protein [Pyrinomonadaceae bacterium]
GTDATLCTAVLDERLLHCVQLIVVRDSFDRCDLSAIHLGHRYETTIHDTTIENDGTRAALALTATFLRAGELELFAQHVEQARHRKDVELA